MDEINPSSIQQSNDWPIDPLTIIVLVLRERAPFVIDLHTDVVLKDLMSRPSGRIQKVRNYSAVILTKRLDHQAHV